MTPETKEKIDTMAKQTGESKTTVAITLIWEEIVRLRIIMREIKEQVAEKKTLDNSPMFMQQIANLTGRLEVLAPVCESLLEGKIDNRIKLGAHVENGSRDFQQPFGSPRIR